MVLAVAAPIYKTNNNFDCQLFAGASCVFGVFDGVHLGHQHLIECAKKTASQTGGKTLVLTFDIDPDEVFCPNDLKKLMSNTARINALAAAGVSGVVVFKFNKRFAKSEPTAFLEATFSPTPPAHLHVGSNFRFGAGAKGNVDVLKTWGQTHGMHVHAHSLKVLNGAPITSSRVRRLLQACNIEDANKLLGHNFAVSGTVLHGRGEGGKAFGIRTANLALKPTFQVLGDGVYAAYAYVLGKRYKAAVNVGVAETFKAQTTSTIEAHILDFSGSIYNEEITLEFTHFLRAMRKFESKQELISTITENINWVRENL